MDFSFLLVMLGLGLLAPEPLYRLLFAAGRVFNRVARHRRLSLVLIGLSSFSLNAALSLFVQMPEPGGTDEHAHLFTADTFAQGRLTNPTPPFPNQFRAPELIVQPTFQSKYPPGQGAVLAVGQLIAGEPIVGTWLSIALGCVAVCWMLQAWVPARWALFGGVLTVLNPWMIRMWGQSYWGGPVAMIGGALVFGAFRRILTSQRPRDALLLAAGLGLLANSRPYEGLVASLPVAILLLVWLLRRPRAERRVVVRRVVIPALIGLAAVFAWMAYYNLRVTGNPFRMPYQVWAEAATHGKGLGEFLVGADHSDADQAARDLAQKRHRLFELWMFYFRIPLTIPLFFLPCALRSGWTRFATLCVLLVLACMMLQMTYAFPHYSAPVTCLVVYLVVQGFRHLRLCRTRSRPAGRIMVACFPLLYGLSTAVFLAQGSAWHPRPEGPPTRTPFDRLLEATEGNHLVFVHHRLAPNERPTDWVYNRADLGTAKVIWVRDRGSVENRAVIDYFPGRTVWLLEADDRPPRLVPYPGLP